MRLSLFSIPLTVTLLLTAASLVQGNHSTCSWKPVTDDVKKELAAWQPWCTATRNGNNQYICAKDAPHGANGKVADWGKLAPKTLELGKSTRR